MHAYSFNNRNTCIKRDDHIFFKFLNINDQRLGRIIDLYWPKLLSSSHGVVRAFLNKGICADVKLHLKMSSFDSLYNILFIDWRILNLLFFCKTKNILSFAISATHPLYSWCRSLVLITICRCSWSDRFWFCSLIMI